jgi:SAM-dependent methyltransferase
MGPEHAPVKSDRSRWNSRYAQEGPGEPAPDPLLIEHEHLLTGDRALDLACGLGADSLFVAGRGYVVDAVDISIVALSVLKTRARDLGLRVRCVVADLDVFPLPKELYDLVMVFYFFAPRLMAATEGALKSGGLLFYATFNHRHSSLNPGFNPDYLVPLDGLAKFFSQLDILLDEPDGGPAGNISRLIARRR